jgi:hypothetical protein
MHLQYRNINHAFRGILEQWEYLPRVREESRVGTVERIANPVLLTYNRPTERVLFNTIRDANPFFHLFEALWMLAGKNDVSSLVYYNSQMEQYSDDGVTFNGAYGYRWRHARDEVSDGNCEIDQLDFLVDHLNRVPNSRRAVLQMWNVNDDLLQIEDSKDCCCNTHVYFSIEDAQLNMTVCNRSNDLIWGLLGANVVHFSFLQEYMAARIGIQVGAYNHFTNNLHAYVSRFGRKVWLEDTTYLQQDYTRRVHVPVPLVLNPIRFEEELPQFVENPFSSDWHEPFFREVAVPMLAAFRWHKQRDYTKALIAVSEVQATDWRWAGEQWLVKRRDNWNYQNTDQF